MKVSAIVPSAGRGIRLRSKTEKPFVMLGDKPILARTLLKLSKNSRIKEIILAVKKDKINKTKQDIINKYQIKKVKVVKGGLRRQDSVYNALKAVSDDADFVLIHDGVRPFVTDKLIAVLLKGALRYGASVAAIPVKPTLKFTRSKRFIEYTPDRKNYWEAQTPQVFRKVLIEKAYKNAIAKNIRATDDSTLTEKIGIRPKIVSGLYSNIKITTQEDLALARILIAAGA